MKLAVSNLAWDDSETDQIISLFTNKHVSAIEIAPSKVWPIPLNAEEEQLKHFRSNLRSRGISIIALQSILYNQNHLGIFENEQVRQELISYMKGIIRLASYLGAGAIVFGSPRNRKVGKLDAARALAIALDFFRNIADTAEEYGVTICIEPNPIVYDCDFLTTFNETIEFVREANHKAIKINVDTGAFMLNYEDPKALLDGCLSHIGHLHISEPFLQPIGSSELSLTYHQKVADSLLSIGYNGWISIEMKSGLIGSNLELVQRAVELAQSIYSIT